MRRAPSPLVTSTSTRACRLVCAVVLGALAGAAVLGGCGSRGPLDDTAIVVLDGSGVPRAVHDLAGAGRETVTGVAGTSGGWAATLRHTAGATIGTEILGAPKDPYGGAALLVRGE